MRIGPLELKIFKNPVKRDFEIGETGTSIFDGYITDEDYVSKLTGMNALDIYDQMRKSDGVVKAALLACELPIRAAHWFVEPSSEDKKDQEVADFVSECLFEKMTITWDDFLRQALLMLPFGHMVFEKVFSGVDFDGKPMIGWKKFAPRLPKTILKWQTEDGNEGITQQFVTGGTVSIPIEKLLIFTHNKEGDNWLGISVLRSAYRPWFFKGYIEKINAMAFERQGLGIPEGTLPKNYTSKDRKVLKDILRNIRANEQAFVIHPEGWKIDFMDMKAKGIKDPSASIQRYNREILISVLAQFLDLGSGPYGSKALSADHSTTFHNNLVAMARQLTDAINKYAIKQLVDLNFTVSKYPKLKFSKIGVSQYQDLAKAISSLVQQGVIMPDSKLEAMIRNFMDLPEKEELEEQPEKEKTKEIPKEKEMGERKMTEFVGWRSLTFAEKKVNLKDVQKVMDETEEGMRKDLRGLLSKMGKDLIRQIQVVLEKTNSTERSERLKNMAIHFKKEYRKIVFENVRDSYQYGKTVASHEMRKTPPPTPAEDLRNFSKQADNLVDIMEGDLLKAGKTALLDGLQHMSFSITSTLAGVTFAVKKAINNVIFNVPAIVINGAINQGRRASFNAYEKEIYALQRSEILDEVTCSYCMSIDSRIFRKNDPFTRVDSIHSNCRGLWVEIMKEEIEKPAITGIPQSLRNAFTTINVFAPPKNPIFRKDSPAAEFLKTASEEKVEKMDKKTASLVSLQETIKDALKDEQGNPTENTESG